MKKYNLLFIRHVAVFVGVISLSLSLLLFVVALIFDTLKSQFLACLYPLFIGALVWAASLARMPRAWRLVKAQKATLGVEFDDTGATPLYPKSGIFLCDTWLIAAGRLYLHRDFIQGVSVRARPWKGRKDYYCLFRCRDGDHRLFVDSSASAKKIKAWFEADESCYCIVKKEGGASHDI